MSAPVRVDLKQKKNVAKERRDDNTPSDPHAMVGVLKIPFSSQDIRRLESLKGHGKSLIEGGFDTGQTFRRLA